MAFFRRASYTVTVAADRIFGLSDTKFRSVIRARQRMPYGTLHILNKGDERKME